MNSCRITLILSHNVCTGGTRSVSPGQYHIEIINTGTYLARTLPPVFTHLWDKIHSQSFIYLCNTRVAIRRCPHHRWKIKLRNFLDSVCYACNHKYKWTGGVTATKEWVLAITNCQRQRFVLAGAPFSGCSFSFLLSFLRSRTTSLIPFSF